ncbi:hypothetical protein AB0D57_13080 [Streptomyces sp. NPDC048275]|uniref:hypothetical protein n=1 Tax=Streptomyces sp. NPDC048275 TaxID=3155629 RepID=UPI0033E62B04
MSAIVFVHGIAQQLHGPETLRAAWAPALRDGLLIAGAKSDEAATASSVAFYGDLFRRRGARSLGEPPLDAADVDEGLERELLLAWWEEAARTESAVLGPDELTRLRTPSVVQRALHALSHSAFFAGLAENMLIGALRQVRLYLTDDGVRAAVRARVESAVTDRTRVVVAHSLGSVVAYEALCAHPEWPVHTFVTLGSPLGIPNLVFDRLLPTPTSDRAHWPGAVRSWSNIADRGDVVALVKHLAPRFGERLVDLTVHNGTKAHDVRPYLTAVETGQAVLMGLRGDHGPHEPPGRP